MTLPRTLASAALGLSLVACGGGGLKLTNIKSTQTKPSNVAAYFKVQTSSGEPIGGLAAEQFKIYEDGSLVSEFESKQVILNPEVAASHYTMLLVDMSGSVAESGAVDSVVEAAAAFTEKVEKSQRVGVYAFDGCGKLHPIASFQSPGGATAAVRSLKGYKPDDPSTDLHGAVVSGIKELDAALSRAPNAMRFGTMVVFTDGSDRAARTSRDDLEKAVDETPYEIFAIGLGAEMKDSELKRVGKTGTAKADDKEATVKAFETIAQRIEATTKSYYLLSYCSPARAGAHKLRIEAETPSPDGKGTKSGSFETEFDATGFGRGCDPKQPPNFDVTKGDALAPKAEKAEEKKPAKKVEQKDERRPAPARSAEGKGSVKGEAKPAAPKPPAASDDFTP